MKYYRNILLLVLIFIGTSVAFSQEVICVNDTICFTNQFKYYNTYSWSFGDGATSIVENPCHTYTTTGTYTVTQNANNGCTLDQLVDNNHQNNATIIVRVINQPISSFVPSKTSGCYPLDIDFTNSSIGTQTASYSWNFGNGSNSTELNPSTTYNSAGTYTVTLIVSDICGSDTSQKIITVNNSSPPTITAISTTPNTNNSTNRSISFSVTVSGAGSTPIYSWDFGDCYSSQDQAPSHIYQTAGEFCISLVISNNNCISNIYSETIEVLPSPVAKFDMIEPIVHCPFSSIAVTFMNMSDENLNNESCKSISIGSCEFTQPDYSDIATSYSWVFDDGTPSSYSGFTPPPISYSSQGSHQVTLIALNSEGFSDTTIKNIFIPECPTIKGTLSGNVLCGSQSIMGDTLYLFNTTEGTIANTVTPVAVDVNGYFEFDGAELALLDSLDLFRIINKGVYPIEDTTSRTINNLIYDNYLEINLSNVYLKYVKSNGKTDTCKSVIVVDVNKNLYVAGTQISTTNARYSRIAVARYKPNGQLDWLKYYAVDSTDYNFPIGIKTDSDGNVYIAGGVLEYTSNNLSASSFIAFKIDSLGDFEWMNTFQSGTNTYNEINAMAMDEDFNIFLTGTTRSTVGSSISSTDIPIVKYNPDGTKEWDVTYNSGTNHIDIAYGITTDASSNVYIAGITSQQSDLSKLDALTAKFNSSGTLVWDETYNNSNAENDAAVDLTLNSNGDVVLVGASNTSTGTDLLAVKYSNSGTSQWANTFYDIFGYKKLGSKVKVDGSDNIYILGEVYDKFRASTQGLLMKLNNSGSQIWSNNNPFSNSISGLYNDWYVDALGNSYILSYTQDPRFCSKEKTYVNKYDTDGLIQWSILVADSTFGTALTKDSEGSILVAGNYTQNSSLTKILAAKIVQCDVNGDVARRSVAMKDMDIAPFKIDKNKNKEEGKANGIKLYPNPNAGNFTLELDVTQIPLEKSGNQFLYVTDVIGNVIYSDRITNSRMEVDLSEQPNGLYFYKVVSGKEVLKTERLMILK